MKIISQVVLLYALTTSFAPAALLPFDDLPEAAPSTAVVPNGYGGLNWSNVYYLNAANNDLSPSGYNNAAVSPPNAAFTQLTKTPAKGMGEWNEWNEWGNGRMGVEWVTSQHSTIDATDVL